MQIAVLAVARLCERSVTMTIKFDALRERWMRDPQFRAAYDKVSPEMEIAFAIAEALLRACVCGHSKRF